jgi:hypothetical protein
MDREELSALQDAIATILAWPPTVFDEVVRWLTPPPKPNRHDLAVEPGEETAHERRAAKSNGATKVASTPRRAKARHDNTFTKRTTENRLLEALQGSAGSSVSALAKASGANRSSTSERLRGLAARGVVTKDSDGHWRLVAELAGEGPGPTQPSPATG